MKNSTNRILVIAVLLLLVTNIFLVYMMVKGKKPGDGRRGRGEPFEMMAKELKMTEEQRKNYKLLREEHQKTVKPLFDSMRAAKTAFYDLLKQETVSDSMVSVHSQKVADRQMVIDKATFAHFQKVRKLFTPEQLPQFDDFMKKMMQRGRRDSTARKDK